MKAKAFIYYRQTAKIWQRFESVAKAKEEFAEQGLDPAKFAIAPSEVFWDWIDYKVEKTNLQTGEKFMDSVNTPPILDPSTINYWEQGN